MHPTVHIVAPRPLSAQSLAPLKGSSRIEVSPNTVPLRKKQNDTLYGVYSAAYF